MFHIVFTIHVPTTRVPVTMSAVDFKFTPIEDSASYLEFKSLPPFVKSEKVLPRSIFNEVKAELSQVKADLMGVHSIILQDIHNETEQMTMLDRKLHDSCKKINHMYMKNLRFRDKYGTCAGGSRQLQVAKEGVSEVSGHINTIDIVVDEIVKKFVSIDNKLPKSQRLIIEDSINERHYPTLFKLLRERCPEKFVAEQVDQAAVSDEHNEPAIAQPDLEQETEQSPLPSETLHNTDAEEEVEQASVTSEPHQELDVVQSSTNVPEIDGNDEGEINSVKETNSAQDNSDVVERSSEDDVPPNDVHTSGNSAQDSDVKDEQSDDISDTDLNDNASSIAKDIKANTQHDISHSQVSIETSTPSTNIRKFVGVPIASSFTLRSFKKPLKPSTLTTLENISGTDITSSHLSDEDIESLRHDSR